MLVYLAAKAHRDWLGNDTPRGARVQQWLSFSHG